MTADKHGVSVTENRIRIGFAIAIGRLSRAKVPGVAPESWTMKQKNLTWFSWLQSPGGGAIDQLETTATTFPEAGPMRCVMDKEE